MPPNAKHVAEYAALRVMAGLFNALPYRVALAAGWFNARLAFALARSRVAEAERRIRQVFGERLSPAEVRRTAWHSWRNLTFSGIEMLRVASVTREWLQAHSDCAAALQTILQHCRTGRGAILAVPHMGNWELAAVTCHLHGIPIFSIAGRQKNPLTDGYLNELRATHGIVTLLRGSGTMKEVLRRLRRGEVLAILPDVRMPTESVRVPFLGAEANLGSGMALFARHADVPIIPGLVRRRGWARHVLQTFAPLEPDKSLDKDADVVRMTAAVMKIIEAAIRAEPGQWFWFNKRWLLDPLNGEQGKGKLA